MRKHQRDINGFLPRGQGLPSKATSHTTHTGRGYSLMAATLSPHITFPVAVYIHTHTKDVCCQQPTYLYFPQYFSQILNGQAYRRLFVTEVLDERPLSTAFFGHLCQVDRWAASPCHWPFCMDKVLIWFSNGTTRQTRRTVSSGWYRVQNGFLTKWPAECKVYKVDNHCSVPPIPLNYTEYPKRHFTKRVKYLNCDYFH